MEPHIGKFNVSFYHIKVLIIKHCVGIEIKNLQAAEYFNESLFKQAFRKGIFLLKKNTVLLQLI